MSKSIDDILSMSEGEFRKFQDNLAFLQIEACNIVATFKTQSDELVKQIKLKLQAKREAGLYGLLS